MSISRTATSGDFGEKPSERFHALTVNNPDAMAVVAGDGRIAYAGGPTAQALGYPPDEILGRNSLDLLHPEDHDASGRLLRNLIQKPDRSDRIEVRFRRKDGSWTWVEAMAVKHPLEPSVEAIVINYRQTSLRNAEEERMRRLNEQLTRSNIELQAFAYTAAHDLMEPLRTVSTLLEYLLRKLALDGKDRHIADLIMAATGRMSVQLSDLLVSATNSVGASPQPVALASVAAQAVENLREAILSSGARIEIGALPTVVGHPSGLIRLFQNLLSNALKYRGEDTPQVQISSAVRESMWVIMVRDNGVGIAASDQQRVFEPFTRLRPGHAEGTGIGLAACKEIVHELGGVIWVESEPGSGCTFCFTAPAAEFALSAASAT